MKKVKLGDLGKIITGNTPSKKILEFYDSNDIPFIKPDDFKTIDEISSSKGNKNYISENARNSARIVPKNSVLVTCIGIIGKVMISESELSFNQQINAIVPNKLILSKYLAYLLLYNKPKLDFISNAPVVPIINKTQFSEFEVTFHEDIDVQEKIIQNLENLDKQILKRRYQSRLLLSLVKSRFNEMFGDPVLNEMGWEKHRLSKLTLKIGSGATPRGGRESYVNEGIALIRSMNVYDGKFIFKDLAYLTNVQAEKLNNVIVESDDVLLNITGASVSRCCIVPQIILPARVNQHVSIIRCKKHLLSPIFLNQLLITSEFKSLLQKIGESSGATRQAITKNQIEELTIPLPPLSLQNEFADFVAQVDKSQLAIQKSLEELETLKKSLMQEYFG